MLPGRIGALRLVRGTASGPLDVPERSHAVVLETNVDDLDPRVWPQVLARLLDEGASDAWLTPILMKKGRPAHTLHVLCSNDSAVRAQLERVVFTETSAIGLRVVPSARPRCRAAETTVDVDGHPVRVKLARWTAGWSTPSPSTTTSSRWPGRPASRSRPCWRGRRGRDRPARWPDRRDRLTRVDWSVALTALVLIVPVELPDKTFVATLVLATRYRPLLVWIGVGLAFIVQTLVAVTAGGPALAAAAPTRRGVRRGHVRDRRDRAAARGREGGQEEAETEAEFGAKVTQPATGCARS